MVSASQGNDNKQVPLLTNQSYTLIETAKEVLRNRLAAFTQPLSKRELDAATDVLFRTVLGHVMRPSAAPGQTRDAIALVAERLLGVATRTP